MSYCSDAFVPNMAHNFMMEDDYNGIVVTWLSLERLLVIQTCVCCSNDGTSETELVERVMEPNDALETILNYLACDDFGFSIVR